MSKKVKVTNNVSSPDITERKEAEEALQESEERYKNLVELSPASIMASDMKGVITSCNPMATKITGYSKDEIIGKHFLKIGILRVSDIPRYVKLLASAASGKVTRPVELQCDRKDGAPYWAEVMITLIKRDGKRVGFLAISTDITERKRAREALQESEQKYRALFENLNDAAFLADAETGRILDTNRQGEVLLGRSREEVIGLHQRELHPPGKAKKYHQRFARHVQKGHAADFDGEAIRKDGSVVPVSISAAPVAIGEKQLILGLFRDITERKRAEEALQQSEHNLKAYLESAPDGVYLNDLKGKFLYGNKKAEELTGYEREELIGSSFLKLNLLPAKHLAKAGKLLALNAIGRPTGPDEFELTRKDGSRIWVEINTTPIKQGGKMEVIGFVRDITERKRAEEALKESRKRYLDLVNLLPQTIFEMDERGNLTFANRQGTLAFGYTLEDVQKGLNALEFFIPEDRDRVRKNVYRILSGEQESGANEYTALRTDGSTFPVISYSSAIIRENKPAGLIGVLMDITDRKRMERELQERNERLDAQNEELQSQAEELMTQQQELMEKTREVEKATQLKSEFLANMSHELRTPLNVIIGFSQLMVDEVTGEINEEQRQSLSDILDGSQCLLNLINEVLDLSKVESGKMELKPKDIALTEVIKSLTRTMMPMLAPRKQSLDIEIEAGLPPVHADKAKLGQVLLNLVDNSSKFTPDGGKLKIEAVKEGDWCQVSVVDNGIGIKKEDQEKIFEPFCRLDDPLTKGRSGTGLGLPLVKQIVERYGGRIWVESEHGKGSRFTVTVSLAASGQPNPEERDRR